MTSNTIEEQDAVNALHPALCAASGGVYVASKVHHYEMWLARRRAGDPIISTWIDEGAPGASASMPDLWIRCVSEASRCDALICYYEEGETLKGALVEIGCALSNGKPCFFVGDVPGTFRNHPLVTQCVNLDDAFARARAVRPSPRPNATAEEEAGRTCTCHPSDKPPIPCARKYALSQCRAAALAATPSEQDILRTCGDDASKWAASFCAIARALGHNLDEGWMIGWFANAIETAHDKRSSFARDRLAAERAECMRVIERLIHYAHGKPATTFHWRKDLDAANALLSKLRSAPGEGATTTLEGEMRKKCPSCGLNWWLNPPAKVYGSEQVRCVECKGVFPAEHVAQAPAAQAGASKDEWQDGWNAYQDFTNGDTSVVNPYVGESERWKRWESGWIAAWRNDPRPPHGAAPLGNLAENEGDPETIRTIWHDAPTSPSPPEGAPETATTMLRNLRDGGWSVAVHNDYRQDGERLTFWLLTHSNGYWIKGEGRTDDIALGECVIAARLFADDSPRAALSAAPSADTVAVPREWQSMLNAPKDGTQILCACTLKNWPEKMQAVIWWEDGKWAGGPSQIRSFVPLEWQSLPPMSTAALAEIDRLLQGGAK